MEGGEREMIQMPSSIYALPRRSLSSGLSVIRLISLAVSSISTVSRPRGEAEEGRGIMVERTRQNGEGGSAETKEIKGRGRLRGCPLAISNDLHIL